MIIKRFLPFLATIVLLSHSLHLPAAPLEIPEDLINKLVGVNLLDLAKCGASRKYFPENEYIMKEIEKNPEQFFLRDVEEIRNVFLTKMPEVNGSYVTVHLAAFVEGTNRFNEKFVGFEKFYIIYNRSLYKPWKREYPRLYVRKLRGIRLGNTEFKLDVGLIERKVVIRDQRSDLVMVFPLGVGSFDEKIKNTGKVNLLTDRIKNGHIDKRLAIKARTRPSYYRGKPFIRISNSSGKATAIGFHIRQNSYELSRGFVSHGCLRMREKDLYTLYYLLNLGNKRKLSVNIHYRIPDEEGQNIDHPWGKIKKSYKRVKNVGNENRPLCMRETSGFWWSKSPPLIVTQYVGKTPPVHLLDDEEDLIEYPARTCRTLKEIEKLPVEEKELDGYDKGWW